MGRAEPGARVAPQRIGGLVAAGGAGQFGQANKRRAVFKQRLQTQPWWRGLCNRAPREAARNIKNMLVNAEMTIGQVVDAHTADAANRRIGNADQERGGSGQ